MPQDGKKIEDTKPFVFMVPPKDVTSKPVILPMPTAESKAAELKSKVIEKEIRIPPVLAEKAVR